MSCQIPHSHWGKVPVSVSLVENKCEYANNNIRVVYNRKKPKTSSKKTFGVCVKGLDFPGEDLSLRLVEWIELVTLLGAGKIYMYLMDVHPNVLKVRRDVGWDDLVVR